MYRDRLVPVALVLPVDIPETEMRTNEELLFWALDLEAALMICNQRLKDAREWGRND